MRERVTDLKVEATREMKRQAQWGPGISMHRQEAEPEGGSLANYSECRNRKQ